MLHDLKNIKETPQIDILDDHAKKLQENTLKIDRMIDEKINHFMKT